MPGKIQARNAVPAPVPLLFFIADTGGGHRNAAAAIGQALDRRYPGRFAPVLTDPLGGSGSAPLLRWITGGYGPVIRLAPWLWGAAYYASNSRPAMRLLRGALLRLADRPAVAAVARVRPAVLVSFHPLTGTSAVRARDLIAPGTPVITVVTDLGAPHAAWRQAGVDLIIGPSATDRGPSAGDGRPSAAGGRAEVAGLPATRDFWAGPRRPAERAMLRRSLGLPEHRFVVLLTGGGEGSGGIARRAAAIVRRCPDVHVVAACGRNTRLRRSLSRLAARAETGGRLTVTGFTQHMSDWLHCADVVVTKAGPGTIAEAACCGAPLVLTAHLPGQERGNTELVTAAGAGCRAAGIRQLVAEIARLRDDRACLDSMRAASAWLGRPGAAADIAGLIAGLVTAGPPELAATRPADAGPPELAATRPADAGPPELVPTGPADVGPRTRNLMEAGHGAPRT